MDSKSMENVLDECADIRIMNPKTGEIHEEKGLVLINTKTNKFEAFGNECLSLEGKNPDFMLVVPIVRGEITDYICTENLFSWMYRKYVKKRFLFIKKSALICVDEPISPINIKVYEDAVMLAGKGDFKDIQYMGASVTEKPEYLSWDQCIEMTLERRKDTGCVIRITKNDPAGYARSLYQNYLDNCKRWKAAPKEEEFSVLKKDF